MQLINKHCKKLTSLFATIVSMFHLNANKLALLSQKIHYQDSTSLFDSTENGDLANNLPDNCENLPSKSTELSSWQLNFLF